MVYCTETFWTNPQYQVEVIDPDENDDENTGTLIVGLMQKDTRKKKAAGTKTPSIGIMVYQVRCYTCTGETSYLPGDSLSFIILSKLDYTIKYPQ